MNIKKGKETKENVCGFESIFKNILAISNHIHKYPLKIKNFRPDSLSEN